MPAPPSIADLLLAEAAHGRAVLPLLSAYSELLEALGGLTFQRPVAGLDELVRRAFRDAQIDTAHPRYFGPAHGTPGAAALLGAALAAAHDPQLATRLSAPFAARAEALLVAAFASKLLPGEQRVAGTFTSGASEALLLGILSALCTRFPGYPKDGLRSLPRAPLIYASSESHPSVVRAARVLGLGDAAVRTIGVDERGCMRVDRLAFALGRDRRSHLPLLVVATVGTTATGAIDGLQEIAALAHREKAWLFADAAYGGMLALTPRTADLVRDLRHADGVGFDPHKTLDVPLGSGIFLTRHALALRGVFKLSAGYLPRGSQRALSPLAWSRGFSALPLLLALGARGFDGVAAALERKLDLGERLRELLVAREFELVNDSALPIVCVVDRSRPGGASARHLTKLARGAARRAGAHVTVVGFGPGRRALRACVTSERTEQTDVEALVEALVAARADEEV